eukprot:TRINITY_DN24714_c0_g1_i1.p1 TRINITY_DN24714_c0_g1~~TRINITY_DN24714_c0_g1_i1.p1  ORF type:complete len:385 (+),score=131.80 TRINITY_DN24714_c0_g1_i1:77-1156(+)
MLQPAGGPLGPGKDSDDEEAPPPPPVPVTDAFRPTAGEMDDAERLRADLSALPEEQDPADIRVDTLAAAQAMLRGMRRRDGSAWRDGEALLHGGLKEAQVPVPRIQGAGLGCDAAAAALQLRPGQRVREVLAAREGPDGKARSYVGVSERLERARRIELREAVVLTAGPHCGAHGVVTGCPGGVLRESDKLRVQLQQGGTEVTVRVADVRLRTEAEAAAPPPAPADMPASAPGGGPRPPLEWCKWPGLLVRFIDNTYLAGRHYNVKMRVSDITSPHDFTLRTPDGHTLDGIAEAQVETVVPKQGGSRVMVVRGKRAGRAAEMTGRDKGRQEVTVRFDGALTKQHTLSFYDVCAICPAEP